MKKNTKTKFMRGAVKYAAAQMGVSLQTAYYRLHKKDPKTLLYIANFEMSQKKKIENALHKYIKARKYNPISNIDAQRDIITEDL